MAKPLIRASFVGKIMAEPKIKADKEAGNLSEGAKTALNKLAKEIVYDYRAELNTKPIKKGLQCEQDSIDLFNRVFFTFHEKNETRISNELMTGECDILADDVIIDIKSSYSLDTFPAVAPYDTVEKMRSDDYYWQGVMYMYLYDKPRYEVAYCMVDTPEEFCQYEQTALHCVSHISENMRVTVWRFDRNLDDEAKMIEKCKKAQAYIVEQIQRIKDAHNF